MVKDLDVKLNRVLKRQEQEYLKGWLEILSKAYPNHWKNKNELFVGHQPGLYNKDMDRLLLMNLTSSYSSFCLITKLLNLYLSKKWHNT